MNGPMGIGSSRVVVGAHYGLFGWMAQRATALVMAAYTCIVLVMFLCAGDATYEGWAGLFSQTWMKIATFATLASVFYHAWVGMRDVWMDYIHLTWLKLLLQLLTILWLLGCAGYSLLILWSI